MGGGRGWSVGRQNEGGGATCVGVGVGVVGGGGVVWVLGGGMGVCVVMGGGWCCVAPGGREKGGGVRRDLSQRDGGSDT